MTNLEKALAYSVGGALGLFVTVQLLWNNWQAEQRDKQEAALVRLTEVNFDLHRRVKELELEAGIVPKSEGGRLPRLPVISVGDPEDEPGLRWLYPRPCQNP